MMFPFSRKRQTQVFHEASLPGRDSRLWMWVGGFVILLLLYVVAGLFAASQALTHTLLGRAAAVEARTAVAQFEFVSAVEHLEEAQRAFEKADRALGFLVPLQVIPRVGDLYVGGKALVHAGATSANIFGNTLAFGVETLELIGEDEDLFESSNKKGEVLTRWLSLDRETRQFILTRLKTRLPSLEVARNELHLTIEDLEDAVSDNAPLLLLAQKEEMVQNLKTAQTYLDALVQGTTLLLSVSGEDGGTILLLFLNDNELRPGGGFLGSFGVLRLSAGTIEELSTYDVMAVDNPATESRTTVPPAPLSEYLNVPAWFLRDANWSPDFAVSSEQILTFFNEELQAGGEASPLDPSIQFDAVVGLTTSVVADFLKVLGDIQVGEDRFTSDNIADTLENAVEFTFVNRGVTHERRKDIIQDIATIMRERFAKLQLSEWSEIFTSVAVRLQDKHLMLYSPDEEIERLFVREGWAGAVAQHFDGDYVMVVDANLASLKTDPAVSRTIDYQISEEDGALTATTTVTYRHEQPFDPKVTRYRTFTRLYVPKGAELISVEGSLQNDRLKNPGLLPDEVVVTEELGKTVFGAFISIEPLKTGRLVFRYRLPDQIKSKITRGTYDLLVQKQLGAQNHALTLDLDFGTKLQQANPAETKEAWGDTFYRMNTILDQDRIFEVDF